MVSTAKGNSILFTSTNEITLALNAVNVTVMEEEDAKASLGGPKRGLLRW